jgi:hypothetical protein
VTVLQYHRRARAPRVAIEGPDGAALVIPLVWTDGALPSEHAACAGEGGRLSGLALLELLQFLDGLADEG